MRRGVDPRGTAELGLTIPPQPSAGERTRQPAVKLAGSVSCPMCHKPKIGVVRTGVHLYIKEHNVITYGRSRPICQASGQRVCDVGEGTLPLNPPAFAATCGGLHEEGA